MAQPAGEVRRICWSDCLSFTPIFRSFKMAIGVKLLIAFAGIVATYVGGSLLDLIWRSKSQPVVADFGGQSTNELDVFIQASGNRTEETAAWIRSLGDEKDLKRVGTFKLLAQHGTRTVNSLSEAALHLEVGGAMRALQFGSMGLVWLLSMHTGFAILLFLMLTAIWAYAGGALSRAAVLDFAREQRISLGEAMHFARGRYMNFFSTPLLPVVLFLFCALVLWLGGWIGAIPWAGEIIAGLLFGLSIIAGLGMAILVIWAIVGFPLMLPSVAAEDYDAVDSASPIISYIIFRPWRLALYYLVALFYGGICLIFIKLFVMIGLWALGNFMGGSMNKGDAYALDSTDQKIKVEHKLDAMWLAPSPAEDRPFYGTMDNVKLRNASAFGAWLIRVWIAILWFGVAAFVVSFFYCSSTIIYFLLRRDHDDTDLEEVFIEQPSAPAPTSPTTTQPATVHAT